MVIACDFLKTYFLRISEVLYLKTFKKLIVLNCTTQSQSLFSTQRHGVKSVRIRSYSSPYFPACGLNKERYEVSLCIQSECGKIRTRISPNTGTFHAVRIKQFDNNVSIPFQAFCKQNLEMNVTNQNVIQVRKKLFLCCESLNFVFKPFIMLLHCTKNEVFH